MCCMSIDKWIQQKIQLSQSGSCPSVAVQLLRLLSSFPAGLALAHGTAFPRARHKSPLRHLRRCLAENSSDYLCCLFACAYQSQHDSSADKLLLLLQCWNRSQYNPCVLWANAVLLLYSAALLKLLPWRQIVRFDDCPCFLRRHTV